MNFISSYEGAQILNSFNYFTGSAVVNLLLIVTSIVGFCNCSMFCWALFCVHSRFAIILMGNERADCSALFVFLVSLDCCVALPHDARGLSAVVIVVFPDHTHLLFLNSLAEKIVQPVLTVELGLKRQLRDMFRKKQ